MKELSFNRYVARQEGEVVGGTEEGSRYAYGADLAMLRTFKRLKPVELAIASVVRTYKDVMRNRYLGTTIRVGPKQLPRIYRLTKECAMTLGVPVPTVYVANSPFMNAYTFGTDEDSFIVIHSRMIDDFTDDELKFVIGHEMGHIQNKHVVYGTALRMLKAQASVFLRWLVPPAELALKSWARLAEVTCDRAGLLCTGDVKVAQASFVKMACGSNTLYEQLDVDAFMAQAEEGRSGVGRFGEMMATHPYLPKRVGALEIFSKSQVFLESIGETGGLSMQEVDKQTADMIQIVRGDADKKKRAKQAKGVKKEETDHD